MDAFVVVDVIERHAKVGHHECIGSEHGGRSGRGPVNRKERACGRELTADFFFLNVKETSDVLDHLLVGIG